MITFISYSDYKSQITDNRINQLINHDQSILDDAELFATAKLQDALSPLHEIDSELAKQGSARNRTLVWYAICIAVYIIYNRVPEDMVPERVVKNYNDVLNDLEAIERGDKSINIARKKEDLDGDGIPDSISRRRFGYDKRRSHLY